MSLVNHFISFFLLVHITKNSKFDINQLDLGFYGLKKLSLFRARIIYFIF